MAGCGKQSCDCTMVEFTSFFTDFDIPVTKQNHTIVHGDGSESDPFYLENIFAQNFLPPAVKLRTTTAIPASTTMFIPFEIADVNTAGMWVPFDNTKITILRTGYYNFGASILWNEKVGSAGTNIELAIEVGTNPTPTSNFPLAVQQSVDENPNTLTHKTTGQTVGFTSFSYGFGKFILGTVLRVVLTSTVNIGATKASFWCCYV